MNSGIDASPEFETATSFWIHLFGVGIEIFTVFIIVIGDRLVEPIHLSAPGCLVPRPL